MGTEGFNKVYGAHDNRNVANFWRPAMVGFISTAIAMVFVSAPVVISAKPDSISCKTAINSSDVCSNCTDFVYGFANDWINETVVTQYDLVCSRADMVHDINSVGFAGLWFAQVWSGVLADRFGRTYAMVVSDIGLTAVCLLLIAFNAYGINIYIIGRFFMTFFDFLCQVSFVYVIEVMSPLYHTDFCMLSNGPFSGIGIMVTSIAGWFALSWTKHLLIIATLSAICIPISLSSPKSFRWLFSSEGENVLRKFCTRAQYEFDQDEVEQMLKSEKDKLDFLNKTSKNIFRYAKCRRIFLSLCFVWFVQNMSFYGILIYPSSNVLFSNATSGAMNFVGGIIIILIMKVYPGRRPNIVCFYIITAVLIAIQTILINNQTVSMLCGSIAFGTSSIAFAILFLYTTELLPTCIRATGFGTLNGVGKAAIVLSPQIMKLNSTDTPWMSNAIFASTLIAASIICYTLPETSDKQLTETLDEAENTFS